MIKKIRFLFFTSIALLTFQSYGQADSLHTVEQERAEKIKQFHADILIKENGNIVVTETIKVYAAGMQIDHGIFRQLPLINHSPKVSRNNFYSVLKVTKNGMNEAFHLDFDSKNITIYIGDNDFTLYEGTYTYQLTYEVEAQIHSYSDFDEIYWNITGNYWVFDIENVSAKVILPKAADVLQTHCYTGYLGSKEKECNSKTIGNAVYFTSKNLKEGEGFTVAVGFSKGIVRQPYFLPHYKMEEFLSFDKTATALLAVCICFLFYFYSWKKYGKDPLPSNDSDELVDLKKLYSAPALKYIKDRHVDSKALLVSIISLSIKGALKITGNGKQNWADKFEYILKKGIYTTQLPKEENAVLESLFKENTLLPINSKTHFTFSEAEKALEKSLKSQFNLKDYFNFNTTQILIGFVITISTLIGYCYYTNGIILWEPIFGFIFLIISVLLIKAIVHSLIDGEYSVAFPCMILLAFPVVFTYAFFFANNVDKSYSALNALVLFLIISGFTIYLILINSYTKMGIMTKIRIEKLKNQLLAYNVAQNANTISDYEENLPYAFALGIEEEWNLKFEDALKTLNYTSNWIKTNDGSTDFSYQTLVRFNTSYTSSSTSSSSGSSGGGSSGGGGGGGGGGGW
jgi:uncharacterized membrane protein YgcG